MKTTYTLFRKNTILIYTVVLLALIGCTDKYNEWNTNPYEATDDMMDHDNLRTGAFFVQMEKNIMICGTDKTGDYQITQNLAGDIYSGFMGACGLWLSNYNNCTYSLVSSWYNAAFNDAYTDIMEPWSSIKTAAEEKTPGAYAMATILKVEGMSRITDMYGPIPYSQFGSSSLQLSYDSQKDVYYKFFDELDSAITTLTELYNEDNSLTLLSKYDFVYNGKVEKWIKFANTLKLRLAIRISNVDPTKAQTEAESAVSHTVGVMTNSDDSAILTQNSDLTFLNPLWEICYSFDEVRMGATMDSYMNGYNDPRLSKYFVKASDGKYRGIRNGINITTKATYSEGPFSQLNFTSGAGMYWMDASEAYFLRAEGAVRGWSMNGTAKDLYESGITTSFSYWGASDVATYLADGTSIPAVYTDTQKTGNSNSALSTITIKWDDNATTAQKLERIITQKWIATYPDGQEAWSEFRRTGYPKVFPNMVNYSSGKINTDTQIRRLPFPSTEYSSNATQVAKAVTLLGGADNGGTRLWWDVENK
jgi:hypothetical protein